MKVFLAKKSIPGTLSRVHLYEGNRMTTCGLITGPNWQEEETNDISCRKCLQAILKNQVNPELKIKKIISDYTFWNKQGSAEFYYKDPYFHQITNMMLLLDNDYEVEEFMFSLLLAFLKQNDFRPKIESVSIDLKGFQV